MSNFHKSVLYLLLISISTTFMLKLAFRKENNISRPAEMPIVSDERHAHLVGSVPNPERGPEVRKWLAPSLKIDVGNASGSGTIVYYDASSNTAYMQTCGHLWSGNMSAEEGKTRNVTCNVITWYHNDQKLDKPKKYKAEVLYYYNNRGKDIGLIKFNPDWIPRFYPIAPENTKINKGDYLHSVGCDGGNEVAHYSVKFEGYEKLSGNYYDLITSENSPRPGRSGGGLFNDNGYYIGICWGTSSRDGTGIGYFTPLNTIRATNEQEGFGFLNNLDILARKIPIIDRNNPQGNYSENYILIP